MKKDIYFSLGAVVLGIVLFYFFHGSGKVTGLLNSVYELAAFAGLCLILLGALAFVVFVFAGFIKK